MEQGAGAIGFKKIFLGFPAGWVEERNSTYYYMTTLNFIYSPLERGRGVSGIAHPKHTPAPLKRGIDTIKSKLVMYYITNLFFLLSKSLCRITLTLIRPTYHYNLK